MGSSYVECAHCRQTTFAGKPSCIHCDESIPLAARGSTGRAWKWLTVLAALALGYVAAVGPEPGGRRIERIESAPASFTAPAGDPRPQGISPPQHDVPLQVVEDGLKKAADARMATPEGLLVLPLLDSSGHTTELGTVLAVAGMYRAAYLPHKSLDLDVFAISEAFRQREFFAGGKTLTDADRNGLLAASGARHHTTGTLEETAEGFRVALRNGGPRGPRELTATVARDDLPRIVDWIARSIHELLGTTLGEEAKRVLGAPESASGSGLRELGRVLALPETQSIEPWKTLWRGQPGSAPLYIECCRAALRLQAWDVYGELAALAPRFESHEGVQRCRAELVGRLGRRREAVELALELLARDWRLPGTYSVLRDQLEAVRRKEALVPVYRFWLARAPDSAAAFHQAGEFWLQWGRELNSIMLADQPRVWTQGAECYGQAEACLGRAHALAPGDPGPPLSMMRLLRLQARSIDEIERWFQKGRSKNPDHEELHDSMLLALKERSAEARALEFARRTVAEAQSGSKLLRLLFQAYRLYNYPRVIIDQGDSLARHEALYQDVYPGMEKLLVSDSGDVYALNVLALLSFNTRRRATSAPIFRAIGDRADLCLWGSMVEFERCRSVAYKMEASSKK